MPDAQGAVGAGAYPALAKDPRLQTPAYPALVVINGQKAMPQFGDALSDDQIANVVNYIRLNFGNRFADKITPAQVKALRPANPK
jgi:mono/diheme cytochrome c family protein